MWQTPQPPIIKLSIRRWLAGKIYQASPPRDWVCFTLTERGGSIVICQDGKIFFARWETKISPNKLHSFSKGLIYFNIGNFMLLFVSLYKFFCHVKILFARWKDIIDLKNATCTTGEIDDLKEINCFTIITGLILPVQLHQNKRFHFTRAAYIKIQRYYNTPQYLT